MSFIISKHPAATIIVISFHATNAFPYTHYITQKEREISLVSLDPEPSTTQRRNNENVY